MTAGHTESTAAARQGGRTPRSRLKPEREAELYAAVLDLLRELGYESLTMDAIAARTRCSKATLYRQWSGKPELVAMALRHEKPASFDGIDTGSLRGDLEALVGQINDRQVEKDTALMRALFHAVHTHPELLQALRDVLIDPELSGFNALLARAAARGEAAADTPAAAYIPQMLLGALITRPLLDNQPADAAFVHEYLRAVVLPALGL
ncbi:TetR/AcrR family transcriptional regulator [Streptomyces gilvus]|uniref:TetR/AcrR family transcriptional regulator n=1 Tax=Streptomyces gilvus TaxID=2920937 RepID=UPI001F0FEA0B|nr:TetR/AcrR family transcriptional regulator [Streptomyces sp. CME 23]MCH5671471.1 TetR/AcrR family transcriptional regulator [Streptomyces sp. CME 23]